MEHGWKRVRSGCRSSGPGGTDEWGSATAEGYLRDDNSLLKAVDVVGNNGRRRDALPIDRVLEIKKKYNR